MDVAVAAMDAGEQKAYALEVAAKLKARGLAREEFLKEIGEFNFTFLSGRDLVRLFEGKPIR